MLSEKAKLYMRVDQLRSSWGLDIGGLTNSISLVTQSPRIELEYFAFTTPGLCGVAMVGDKSDTITLNSNRTSSEQNFDCCHELMHLQLHRKLQKTFNCFSRKKPLQDSFQEWQANEGAAQFLVPYQDFIPAFVSLLPFSGPSTGVYLPGILADRYGVTTRVIEIRMDSLSYEIDQYRRGVPIDQIELLSKKQRRDRSIIPTNYAAACDFGIPWDAMIG